MMKNLVCFSLNPEEGHRTLFILVPCELNRGQPLVPYNKPFMIGPAAISERVAVLMLINVYTPSSD